MKPLLSKLGILLPLLCLVVGDLHGETLDQQIQRLKAEADSLNIVANVLAGTKYAARMDSLVAADPVLAATKLHLRATSRDSSFVVVVMDSCTALHRQLIRGALKAEIPLDTYMDNGELWVRWRALERIALPALKRDLK